MHKRATNIVRDWNRMATSCDPRTVRQATLDKYVKTGWVKVDNQMPVAGLRFSVIKDRNGDPIPEGLRR